MIVLLKKKVIVDDVGRQALFAVYPSDSDKLNAIPEMQQIVISVKKGRSAKHHALIFALARLTKEHLDLDHPLKYSSLYMIVKSMMAYCGMYDDIVDLKTCEIQRSVQSIAFENMTGDEFKPVSDLMFKACADTTGINEADLRREYKRYL